MLFRCAFNIEIYVKVWILVIPPLTWVRLVTSSALQSRKWQLIGMSQWCRSALCGHPLPAHFQNFIQFCLVFVHLRYERSKIRDDDTILKSFLHLPIFCARCVGGFSDWQTRVVTPCYLLTSVIYFFSKKQCINIILFKSSHGKFFKLSLYVLCWTRPLAIAKLLDFFGSYCYFYARCYPTAAYAVMRYLSVRPSVRLSLSYILSFLPNVMAIFRRELP